MKGFALNKSDSFDEINCEVISLFQPIVFGTDKDIYGYEALSRDSLGVNPFTLSMSDLTRLALEGKCALQAARLIPLIKVGQGVNNIFINLSPTLIVASPIAFFEGIIQLANIEGVKVVFEITEHSFDEAKLKALQIRLDELRSLGFAFAIDDLGQSYSSLRRLNHIRPEYIKLDRFLINQINEDRYRQHIVSGLVRIAYRVGSLLIAEGVETSKERETLLRLGITLMQGFYFGRPAKIY